jgi:hypothetical protein
MGEIKSTLDLVMEKTRHLTLSQEEKDAQHRMDANKKLKGLLQKYQDNRFKKERLEKELDTLRKTYDFKIDEMLISLLLDGLKLDRSNELYLELLYEVCGIDVSRLESIFYNFQNTLKAAAARRIAEIKESLAKERFISGSAVVPHLDADAEWMATLQEINDAFEQELLREKDALTGSLSP